MYGKVEVRPREELSQILLVVIGYSFKYGVVRNRLLSRVSRGTIMGH